MRQDLLTATAIAVGLGASGAALAQARPAQEPLESTLTFKMMDGLTGHASARSQSGSQEVPIVSSGEPFTAAVVAQNSTTAFFIDGFPDSFSFERGPQDGGFNLITGAATSVVGAQLGTKVIVAAFTNDSSDWLPFGIDPGDGDPLTALRLDVGAFANALGAGVDPITYPGFVSTDVLSVDVVLFIDGAAVFAGQLGSDKLDFSSGLAAAGIVGDVAGAGVDEIQVVFNLVPAPGAWTLVGFAGVAAMRRRRR